MRYTCVDLFSGMGGFSEGFRLNGCNVIRIDNDRRFKTVPDTIIADILELDPQTLPYRPDFLVMSPPCTPFSVGSVSSHWERGKIINIPKETARFGILLVKRALEIKDFIKPRFWCMENPTGMLRKVIGYPNIMTHFCSWMDPEMNGIIRKIKIHEDLINFAYNLEGIKTDINVYEAYREFVSTKVIIKELEIVNPPKKSTDLWGLFPTTMTWEHLIEGTWELAPRGSKCGVQRIKDPALRAKIPYRLSEALYEGLVRHDELGLKDLEDFTIPFFEQQTLEIS